MNGGEMAGEVLMIADANGVAGFQPDADHVIAFGAVAPPPTGLAFIV